MIVQASSFFHPLQTMDLRACEPFLTENFIPHGYAVAFLAIRGTADSGGCMNLMGSGERADIDQAITWLGDQGWSN
ncbi:MAG TPA: CocE/NonD family hydrolase, partial [Actinomycetota bacterium]|nr:CocE/NonD family hydrolase [Actinomycetota bacterium]